MRQRLFKGEYSASEKRTYLSKYQTLLPPIPPVALLTLSNTAETKMQVADSTKMVNSSAKMPINSSETQTKVIINPADTKYAPTILNASLNHSEFQTMIRNHLLQNHFPLGSTIEFLEATVFPDSLQKNLSIGAFEHQHGHHYYYYQPYHRHGSYFFPHLGWLSHNDTFWALAILNGLVESRNL